MKLKIFAFLATLLALAAAKPSTEVETSLTATLGILSPIDFVAAIADFAIEIFTINPIALAFLPLFGTLNIVNALLGSFGVSEGFLKSFFTDLVRLVVPSKRTKRLGKDDTH